MILEGRTDMAKRISEMTEEELYTALQEIDSTPCDGNEALEQRLMDRAERLERELDARAEEDVHEDSPSLQDTGAWLGSYAS
jgi:hypothetical protein